MNHAVPEKDFVGFLRFQLLLEILLLLFSKDICFIKSLKTIKKWLKILQYSIVQKRNTCISVCPIF